MAGGTASESKRGKRRKLNVDKKIVDRLSTLPDEILTHILSFLPLKEAIKTSIFSKRWRYSWTLVSKLEFIDDDLIPSQLRGNNRESARWFGKLVDGVLKARGSYNVKRVVGSSSIKVFKLYCSFHSRKYDVCSWISPSRIQRWVSYAVMPNVEDLHLAIFGSKPIHLTHELYTCERLRVLRLGSPFILDVPDMVGLKSLKTLSLNGVDLYDDNSLNKLLSACKVEDLHLGSLQNLRRISCIRSASLKYLFIMDKLANLNAECNVVVDTPQLERIYLSIRDGRRKSFSLERLPFLNEAHIAMPCCALNVDVFLKLLESISKVEILRFKHFMDNALDIDHYHQLPVFFNLKRLEIKFWDSWKYVPYLLQQSPNLETLVLEFEFVNESGWDEPDNTVQCLCLSSHLKKVTFKDFEGWDIEMEAVQYLLKNGMVLNTMTLYSNAWTRDVSKENDLLRTLLTFPRGSSTCQIHFLDS